MNEEFIHEFIEEAKVHIEKIESHLLNLTDNENDEELINQLFRSMHSIKGTAGFFGLNNVVRLSHSMENLFGLVRKGDLLLADSSIDTLLEANDCLGTMVKDPYESQNVDITLHIDNIEAIINPEKGPLEGNPNQKNNQSSHGEAMESPHEEAMEPSHEGVIESSAEDAAGSTHKEVTEASYEIDNNLSSKGEESLGKASNGGGTDSNIIPSKKGSPKTKDKAENDIIAPVSTDDSVRVPILLLNDLLDLTGELVLGRNQLLRSLDSYKRQMEGISPILQNIDSITTQLQERVMQTRMQPLANVFNKFPRIIRDLSRQLKKKIKLEMDGTQVELDKSIIEALADPLTHLIRNAADHGIEDPKTREEAGKSQEGTIKISALQEGGYVSISVIDDGAGIEVENIRSQLLKKSLKTREELAHMDERETLEQILIPGFSTSEKVNDLSGRGVGMDVVRTNIEKIGGTVEIDSRFGRGTTLKLNLPLTLAIISSLIVESEGQNFALPQANLQEMIRLKSGDENRFIEFINGLPVLRFRNELLPILCLSHVLNLSQDCDRNELFKGERIIRILILKTGGRRFGLVVDSIYDDEEILVKPLPRHLKDLRYYSGVTILGDGGIAMILDVDGLAGTGGLKFPDSDEGKKDLETSSAADEGKHSTLLFTCSGPEILGIELSEVFRVDEIKSDEIQLIGDKEYINFRGRPLRVLRLENYLPLSGGEYEKAKLYIIIPKRASHPTGLLIGKILDTTSLKYDLDHQDIRASGIMGTSFWRDKITLIINPEEIFKTLTDEDYNKDKEYTKMPLESFHEGREDKGMPLESLHEGREDKGMPLEGSKEGKENTKTPLKIPLEDREKINISLERGGS